MQGSTTRRWLFLIPWQRFRPRFSEVYQNSTQGKKSYVPQVWARGGVGRRGRNRHWASRRCQKLSRSRQRGSKYPKMVKNGKTHHRLSKNAKSKKITCSSTFLGVVGSNSGNCGSQTRWWGGVTHGGSAMGSNWEKWRF